MATKRKKLQIAALRTLRVDDVLPVILDEGQEPGDEVRIDVGNRQVGGSSRELPGGVGEQEPNGVAVACRGQVLQNRAGRLRIGGDAAFVAGEPATNHSPLRVRKRRIVRPGRRRHPSQSLQVSSADWHPHSGASPVKRTRARFQTTADSPSTMRGKRSTR